MTVINDEEIKKIGKRLQELRKSHKFTREKIAEKLSRDFWIDVDTKTLQRYENGEFLPKLDNLIALSELYGVTLDFIIFGKSTSDDDSYLWRDSLKRLNRLMYSLVLIPWKDENKDSPFYGKYYFTAFDDEISVYMERIVAFSKNQNYSFETRGKDPTFDISDWDKLIDDFEYYNESLIPSEKRVNEVLVSANDEPDVFLKEKIEAILKKRKV